MDICNLDSGGVSFTTSQEHSLRPRRIGQLYASDGSDMTWLSPLVNTDLKIATVPSKHHFTVQSKALTEAQLVMLSSQLQADILRFG